MNLQVNYKELTPYEKPFNQKNKNKNISNYVINIKQFFSHKEGKNLFFKYKGKIYGITPKNNKPMVYDNKFYEDCVTVGLIPNHSYYEYEYAPYLDHKTNKTKEVYTNHKLSGKALKNIFFMMQQLSDKIKDSRIFKIMIDNLRNAQISKKTDIEREKQYQNRIETKKFINNSKKETKTNTTSADEYKTIMKNNYTNIAKKWDMTADEYVEFFKIKKKW